MHATNPTLSGVLAVDGNLDYYHVPRYQREYTWGRNEWERLLVDIDENNNGYFMGSIICIDRNSEPAGPQQPRIFELVDGQQRLTTLSILLMSIYKKLKDVKTEDLSEREQTNHQLSQSHIERRVIHRAASINNWERGNYFEDEDDESRYCFLRLCPSTQGENYVDYLHILEELGLIKGDYKSRNCGNRRLHRAYDYFSDRIPNGYRDLMDILSKVNGLNFIHISVPSSSDAFVLFDALNNRGIPLSAMDIIKNKILARLEDKHGMNINVADGKWKKFLEYLPKEYGDQERFLRQYQNAFPKTEKEYAKATKSTLIKIYEGKIKKDAVAIMNDLLDKAKIYKTFIDPKSNELENREKHFLDLNRIGSAPSYLFLLYLYSLPPGKIEDREKTIDDVLEFFIKYYVRRNITDFPRTRDLDTINMRVVEMCHRHIEGGERINGKFIIDNFIGNKSDISKIGVFKKALEGNLYDSNVDMARFVLTKLDEEYHSREYRPDLWARNDNGKHYVWTIEHIFPKSENITQPWVNMVANGDPEKAEEIRKKYVHCLGNLTLSGYNSKLGKAEFTEKQNLHKIKSFGHEIRIGYKNGLALNDLLFSVNGEETNLARIDKWTEESIKARNARIVDDSLEMFSFSTDEMKELIDDE